MRILLVGGSGMLGTDVLGHLLERGHEVVAPTTGELDITDPVSVGQIPAGPFNGFDWCVNCAGYTAVDKAETEVREATELNQIGVGYLAGATAAAGTRLIHVSTDFVFDGESDIPYTEEAETNPLSVYGRTKREGERQALGGNARTYVLRSAWLYGVHGRSFPGVMIDAHRAGKQLRVVNDQVGNPTSTVDLAEVIGQVIEKEPYPGLYHASGPDAMSWYEFAQLTLRLFAEKTGSEPASIEPISTAEWPTPAKRPRHSVLDTNKLVQAGISQMRPARQSLQDFVERYLSVMS